MRFPTRRMPSICTASRRDQCVTRRIEMTQRVTINFRASPLMARRIKRYDNRKLYDTETSEYVSLSDIADLVRGGETVEVVDNATGQDLTAQTLTQIILEEGKSGQDVIPSDLLHVVLRRGGEVLDNGLGQVRTMLDDLTQSSLGQLRQLVQGPRKQEIGQLRQQLRRLEHRLSVLLDDFDEQGHASLDAQPHAPGDLGQTSPPERADSSSQK